MLNSTLGHELELGLKCGELILPQVHALRFGAIQSFLYVLRQQFREIMKSGRDCPWLLFQPKAYH